MFQRNISRKYFLSKIFFVAEEGNGCNCDLNDENWRYDDGYITDKTKLPISAVQFTEETEDPRSKFTVGRLECFGYHPPPTPPATTAPPAVIELTPVDPVVVNMEILHDQRSVSHSLR